MRTFTAALALALVFTATAFAQQKGTFKDARDGKTYKTVKIGGQTWMAENLNYRGTAPDTIGVCYDNKAANCTKYGRLYDWETAMGGAVNSEAEPSGVQGVCPAGWHLPSDEEWNRLYHFADGTSGDQILYKSPTAGKFLKAKSGWNTHKDGNNKVHNSNGEDKFGFSALPGGSYSLSLDRFMHVGEKGYWWTSSESLRYIEPDRGMDYAFYMSLSSKNGNYSVRCLKDYDAGSQIGKPSSSSAGGSGYAGSYGSLPYQGKTYKTVVIGTQTWMAENLNYLDKEDKESRCPYNKIKGCEKYGMLYNWKTAMKICPKGWHLPNNADWDKLYRYADGDKGTESPYSSKTAGKYLKATSGWNDYVGRSGNGEDKFDFSAMPGGYGYYSFGNVDN